MTYSLLYNNNDMLISVQFYTNIIFSFVMIFTYYVYLIFVLIIEKGNDRMYYFVNIPSIKCIIHNCYTCNCTRVKKINSYSKEEIQSVNEYIGFYNKYYSAKTIIYNIRIIIIAKINKYRFKNLNSNSK